MRPLRSARAARAATLIARYDNGDYDAVRFIQSDTTVHVLAPPDFVPERHKELFGGGEGEQQMRFMLGETWSVCGVRFVRHRGGFEAGARLLSHFPDELLCQHCHAAFGDRGAVIFEVNQDDGRDPTQLGQLVADTVTKGHRPLR